MGMDYDDYVERQRTIEKAEADRSKLRQLERQIQRQQMRELMVDPKWEAYAQELDKLLATATGACEGLSKKLLEGDLDNFKKLMPDYRYNLGIKKAFEEALKIVREVQGD